jgi:ERCC4-related helicase
MSILTPREYQRDAVEHIWERNTIINIRTGGGKTLIAVLAIKKFMASHPKKNILFVVPTRALVCFSNL